MLVSVNSFLTMVSIVGIIGNLIVISVYTRKKDRLTSTFFILILAFSDLIVCSVLIPMTIYFENISFHTANIYLCKTYFFVTTSTVPASCLLMTAIAFDRYFCICMVNRNIMTPFRAKIIVCILLILSGMLSVIPTLNAIISSRTYSNSEAHNETQSLVHSASDSAVQQSHHHTTLEYDQHVASLSLDKTEYNSTAMYEDSAYSVCEIDVNGRLGSWVMPFKRFYDLIYFCSVIIISILYILIYKKIYTRRKAKRLRKRRLLTNSMLYNGTGGGDFEQGKNGKRRTLVVSESASRRNSSRKTKTQLANRTQLVASNSRIGGEITEMETLKFIEEEEGKAKLDGNNNRGSGENAVKSINNHRASMIKSGKLVKETIPNDDTNSLNTTGGCCLISMSVCFGQFIIDNKKAANLKKKIANNTSSGSRSCNTEFIERCSVTKPSNRVLYADQIVQVGEEPKKSSSQKVAESSVTNKAFTKPLDENTAEIAVKLSNIPDEKISRPPTVSDEKTATPCSSILKSNSSKKLDSEKDKAEPIPRALNQIQNNGSSNRLTICVPNEMNKMVSSDSISNDNKSLDGSKSETRNSSVYNKSLAGQRISLNKMTPLKISIKDIRTAFMLFVVSLLFIIFYLPSILATKSILSNDNLFLVYLYFTNSAINPMIYCFMNRSFRSDLLKIFIKRNRKFLPPTSRFSTLIAISINPNVMELKNSK